MTTDPDNKPYDMTSEQTAKQRSTQRREILDEMVEIAEEAGMYDEDDFPTKTR